MILQPFIFPPPIHLGALKRDLAVVETRQESGKDRIETVALERCCAFIASSRAVHDAVQPFDFRRAAPYTQDQRPPVRAEPVLSEPKGVAERSRSMDAGSSPA